MVLVALVQLAPPKVIGIVLMRSQKRDFDRNDFILDRYFACRCISTIYFRFVWRINIWGVLHAWKKLTSSVFDHFTKMDHLFYQKHRTGDLMAHATNDLNAIQNVAGAGILTFADSFISGGATIIAMILLSIGV